MRYPQQGTYCGSVTFIKPFVILMLCSDSSDFLTQNKQTKTQQNKFNTFSFFLTALSAYQRYYSLQSDYWKVCICNF